MATKTKAKTVFVCSDCGSEASQWQGQCRDCGAWNTYTEFKIANTSSKPSRSSFEGYAGAADDQVMDLSAIPKENISRIDTGISELDRALGGGLVKGSVNLIGGDPGIGKSTLLLQATCSLSKNLKVLYITGEESLQQVSLRADRLGLDAPNLRLYAQTCVEQIMRHIQQEKPQVLVIDSIQTMFTESVPSAPGSVTQVRESAAALVRYAKQTHTALFFVGHVTKDGSLAGPRVLEHMVDGVLYFEGQTDNRFRIIRAIKNRFGAVNEIGVFAMTDKGLKGVTNPSAIFLASDLAEKPGSVVMVTWEGTRPMLVEIQALVDTSHAPNPRRIAVGLDHNRLSMLLAVLSRHTGITTYDQDVFVNVVGGMKIQETAIDLALAVSIISSLRDKTIAKGTVVFGEIGLSGEIRPVQSGQERISEAAKQGFTRVIVPKQNAPKTTPKGVEVFAISHLSELVGVLG